MLEFWHYNSPDKYSLKGAMDSPIILRRFEDFVEYYEMSKAEQVGFASHLSHSLLFTLLLNINNSSKYLEESRKLEKAQIEEQIHDISSAFVRAFLYITETEEDYSTVIEWGHSGATFFSIMGLVQKNESSRSISSKDIERYEKEFYKLLERNTATFPGSLHFQDVFSDFMPKRA